MTKVIEVDEAGRLVLPPEMLGEPKPRARYVVATEGSTVVVSPGGYRRGRRRAGTASNAGSVDAELDGTYGGGRKGLAGWPLCG